MPDHPHEHIPSAVRELRFQERALVRSSGGVNTWIATVALKVAVELGRRADQLEAQAKEADDVPLPSIRDLHAMDINITDGADAADYVAELRSGKEADDE